MIRICRSTFVRVLILIVTGSAVTSPISAPASSKPTIAVADIQVGEGISLGAAGFLNKNLEELRDELEASLVGTRKFGVVTRSKEKLKKIRDEQEFSNSDFSIGNAAKIGKLLGADYYVFPTVNDFSFYRKSRNVPNVSGKYFRIDGGRLVVNVEIVNTQSGQITANYDTKSSFSTKEKIVNSKSGLPSHIYYKRMAKEIGARFADELIDWVFPILVLKSDGKKIWINRGQDGGLKKGDVLNIYTPGEDLIDPVTKENLGPAEEYVGQAKVVRVNPKHTIAAPIGPAAEAVAVGYILRRPN